MKTINRRLLTVVAACLAVPAFAQTSAREYSLDIERQPLAAALTEFSKQTGLQVGYFPETLTENIFIGPLSGSYTAEAAITQLLLPSGLSFERLNERTIAVTSPESTKSLRRTFSTIERRTDDRSAPSFVRLANLRLAEGPVAEDDGQQIRTAANAREADDSKRKRLAGALEEVIVTAQKREEWLQDVPISISVMSGDELGRSTVEGVTEALSRVPGVTTMVADGGSARISIRGVLASAAFNSGSSPIAYYLDAVPMALVRSAIVPDANAYDLERVEVVRGPQGTLYGASSLNGLVRVLTKDANPNEFELKARTSASTTQRGGENYRGDMAVNVPIIDGKLAARAMVGYQDISGWIDRPNEKDANGAEIRNARLKINAQPTDQLSIGLSGQLSRADYDAAPSSDEFGRHPSIIETPTSNDYDAYSLKISYEFARFSASSMTNYLDFSNVTTQDARPGGAPLFLFRAIDADALSQEVILISTHDGPWRWTVGGMYRDAEERLTFAFRPATSDRLADNSFRSKSFAAFGELTRLFLDGQLELTAGLRYFDDEVTMSEIAAAAIGLSPVPSDTRKFDTVTPRAVLTWHPSDDLTIYASYAEGFRSGFNQGPNTQRVAPSLPPVKEDTLENYELGAKSNLWGGRVKFDTALYYIDWQDQQQTLLVSADGVTFFNANINSESVSGLGIDLGVTVQPIDSVELGLGFSWNDLAIDTDVLSGGVVLYDAGDRPAGSAEYTAGASADYILPFGRNGFEARFSASANYISKVENRALVGGQIRHSRDNDDILIARTSFSVHGADDRWAATFFVDNVNDERGSPFKEPQAGAVPTFNDLRVRPRTFGVQLDYRY